ncbi:MAG: hypothetical protein GKB99_02790, partial [Methanocellales archaeon]|nr:hypothetical protein [Methanocellales archaeon]
MIKEPYLEFSQGIHCCPRAGITEYMVYDSKFKVRKKEIFVGAVGTSQSLQSLNEWIEKCSNFIAAKPNSNQPNLYTSFSGFNENSGFSAKLIYEEEITKRIFNRDIKRVLEIRNWNKLVSEAVDLFYNNILFLAQNRNVDVIVCVIPNNLYKKIVNKNEDNEVEEKIDDTHTDIEMNFRRALKAKAMHLSRPIQIIRQLTFQDTSTQQDIATKAWNFCTAVYYKTGQTVPWKLIKNEARSAACYVGIGFYRSRDKKILNTSLAQIFNDLGNGVILRGTPVEIDKNDRRPHLTSGQAYELLSSAINEYEFALETSPGRLVIHKTSNFSDEEIAGLRGAAEDRRINSIDFITILDSTFRFFRDGIYPPARGLSFKLDRDHHILYT